MTYPIIISLVMLVIVVLVLVYLILNRKKIKIKILQEKAEKGVVEAQTALGVMYLSGLDVEKDRERGKYYIEMASKNGSPSAQYVYAGLILEDSNITNEKIKESLSWIEKSAENGYLKAITTLASMYSEGKVCNKDYDKSLYYFEMAARKGDVSSQVTVAGIYDFSLNGDKIKAYSWYKTASFLGSEYAEECASKIYNNLDDEKKKQADNLSGEYIKNYGIKINAGNGKI